jgi:hypothetical protein
VELIQDGGPDGLDPIGLASDEARMSARHADRETGGENSGPRRQSGLNGLFQRKDRMVSETDIPNGGHPGLKCAPRQLGGFE